MKAYRVHLTLLLIAIFTVIGGASAQTQTAPGATSGFRADFLLQLDDAQKKIISLAEAVPEDKYGWRPAEKVRSVSEVYMHIAGANYFFPTFAGINPPSGITRDLEKTVTEKSKVLESLKQSFDHLRAAFEKTPDADMEKKVKFFSGEASLRYVYLVAAMHIHEHLGQSIAYARTNGIAPPWSNAAE
jgi:uncharacterized damage-inducible protein DinB